MNIAVYTLSALLVPFLLIGFVQKAKAQLQNRVGASVLQPFFNIFKLFGKNQIISEDSSGLFRAGILVNFCCFAYLIWSVPWLSFSPAISSVDIFLFVYLLATARFFSILSALDTGSPFGAFAGSREATLSFLVEPAMILSLVAPSILTGSSSLERIFSFTHQVSSQNPIVWIFAGISLFLVALTDLSRMPVDDPTTHLELTMVHEAMTIEASGRNLALSEIGYAFKLAMFFGLSVQCLLHGIAFCLPSDQWILLAMSIAGIFSLGLLLALLETVLVKLKWTKCPDFIAYSLTMGLFACIAALGVRA
ncbi:MAG: NADH-quinone oxidoreductase subunit H [Cyanobacteria bacterium TGS_CYA1]|nr:NADH-quinone oxidoreductase subunit H [Cyanobacteria bacterium TGS_CYA1]